MRKYRGIGKLALTMKFITDRNHCDDPPPQGLSEARRGRVFSSIIYRKQSAAGAPRRGRRTSVAFWGMGVSTPIIISKKGHFSSNIHLLTNAEPGDFPDAHFFVKPIETLTKIKREEEKYEKFC